MASASQSSGGGFPRLGSQASPHKHIYNTFGIPYLNGTLQLLTTVFQTRGRKTRHQQLPGLEAAGKLLYWVLEDIKWY